MNEAASSLTWDDVQQFDRVPGYAGAVWKNGSQYYFVGEVGTVVTWLEVYELPTEYYEMLETGERTQSDIHHRLRTGEWLPTEEQRYQSRLQFFKSDLQNLHEVVLVNNPDLFLEFPELEPIYLEWLDGQSEEEKNDDGNKCGSYRE